MIKPSFKVWNDDGTEEMELPCKFVVCPRCNGSGVHDHPAFSNGISQEQFDEDPDFEEQYRAGSYDVRCTECDGERLVSAPDEEHLNEDQKRWLEAWREDRAMQRAEKRMREQGIQF